MFGEVVALLWAKGECGADRLAHQPSQVAIVFLGKVRFRRGGDLGVADSQEESEIEHIIVAAIEKHARGDVDALVRGIIEELRAAGLEIQRIDAILIRNPRRRADP